ncbi:helix-turn-helix domain-containing protein [Microbispora sp. NEAU-D428]|uniref:IclR family transcriptional regulator n=1 Tax=Microbispora sitophila TaxID=2771537 RepID=UPI001867E055|nr:helix-turn-helix domain-containing protein [Microbispora sitophila]MBE3014493.1 helix-turn-helix domain-containing protein [Microbispora sitophila]
MAVTRRSPPARRVVAVLDHLVAAGGRGLGLSALARELGISKPTCLGILTELVAAGYLVRDPATLTYGLGPALIAAGRAARRGFLAGDVARRHLEPLAERYHATCTASAVVGDEIMVLDAVVPPGDPPVRVGERYPFAPPVGLMYVLWGPDRELERWLAREPTLPVRMDREHLRAVVGQCRAAGYLVESLTPAGMRLHSLMAGVAAYELPREVRALVGEMVSSLGERVYLGADLNPRKRHPVNLVAAPAYGPGGEQELVLTLHVGASVTGAEIARRGAALVAAADAVTAELGGTVPDRTAARPGSGKVRTRPSGSR